MDLSFGTNVLEHGYRIGRLAGVEVDGQTRAVRHILVSADGRTVDGADKRPLAAVPPNHFDGDILLNPFIEQPASSSSGATVILTDATRVFRAGRKIGHLAAIEVSPQTGEIVSISGRPHWWSRRFQLKGSDLDLSAPGEIRVVAASTQAA